MNRLAIFVEGQTEQLFVEWLLCAVAGREKVTIKCCRARGGSGRGRGLWELHVSQGTPASDYFVLVVDSGGDSSVKSDIVDNYARMARQGYTTILGIRDVFPDFKYDEIEKLRAGLASGVETAPTQVLFVLGIMEIETWFICEHSHFQRLDSRLTVDYLRERLGFDPAKEDIERRDHPAKDLDDAYRLVNRAYRKKRSSVQRTLDKLDYAKICCEVRKRCGDLGVLLDCIDSFLAAGCAGG